MCVHIELPQKDGTEESCKVVHDAAPSSTSVARVPMTTFPSVLRFLSVVPQERRGQRCPAGGFQC